MNGLFREPLLKPEHPPPVRRSWLIVGALLGWLCLRVGLEWLQPISVLEPHVPWVGPIKQAYAEREDEVDLLLLGSSRVYRGIDPEQLEAVLAQNGIQRTVFNHGWPNQHFLETHTVLDSLRPGTLKTIVFEPAMFTQWVIDNRNSLRAQTFFGPENTRRNLRHLSCAAMNKGRRQDAFYNTILAFSGQMSGLGRLNRFIRPLPDQPPANPSGFRALDTDPGRTTAQGHAPGINGCDNPDPETGDCMPGFSAEFERQRDWYRKVLANPPNLAPRPIAGCQIGLVQSAVQKIRALGAEPIVVIAPTFMQIREYAGLRRALSSLDVPVLAYDRPQQFPELYEDTARFDMEHLNRKGATAWTERLGGDLAEILREP